MDYIHKKFERQVEKTPDAIAIVSESQKLSYKQLNEKANQLANHLISLGVKPDMLVGICMDRSSDLIVGLLAILKAEFEEEIEEESKEVSEKTEEKTEEAEDEK